MYVSQINTISGLTCQPNLTDRPTDRPVCSTRHSFENSPKKNFDLKNEFCFWHARNQKSKIKNENSVLQFKVNYKKKNI